MFIFMVILWDLYVDPLDRAVAMAHITGCVRLYSGLLIQLRWVRAARAPGQDLGGRGPGMRLSGTSNVVPFWVAVLGGFW